MTQKFNDSGIVVPVTAIAAGPCLVTQVKTKEKDGYEAVQLGFGKAKKIAKPQAGHAKDLENFAYFKEFSVNKPGELGEVKRGDKVSVEDFSRGDLVQVIGFSKGKGFQGVVRRHHFHGHPETHGHKDQVRMPGSIGAGGVQHVFKGMRMAGHMGDDQVTVKNLEVIDIDGAKNLIYLKGAVPGARGGMLEIRLVREAKK